MEVMVGAFGVARQEAIAAAEQLQSVSLIRAIYVTSGMHPTPHVAVIHCHQNDTDHLGVLPMSGLRPHD